MTSLPSKLDAITALFVNSPLVKTQILSESLFEIKSNASKQARIA